MGQTCCKNQQIDFGREDSYPNHDQFDKFQLIKQDPLIQQWLANSKNQVLAQQNQQNHENMHFWKIKGKDLYYYFKQINKLPNGYGFIYSPNIVFYSGEVKNGIPEGKAFVKLLDKQCIYEGDVKGWRAHGVGVLQNIKQKYKIHGNWNNSILTSAMITFFNDPNMQSLQISDFNSKRGSISYRDKRWYEGQIHTKKLVPHGYGRLVFPFDTQRKQYEGEWYLGQMSGKGKLTYSNQSIYDGEFFHGKKQGFGKFIFPNRSFYEGYWKQGKQQGVGALYTYEGKIAKYGMWKNGKFDYELNENQWREKSSQIKNSTSKIIPEESGIINRNSSGQQFKIKMTESRTYERD